MKKAIVALALIAAVGFAGANAAEARWGGGWMMGGAGGNGPGYCNGPGSSGNQDYEAIKNFQNETTELREQIFEKRQEYAEILRQENPDKELAKQIWSELFDLQNEMREKALTAGLFNGDSTKL